MIAYPEGGLAFLREGCLERQGRGMPRELHRGEPGRRPWRRGDILESKRIADFIDRENLDFHSRQALGERHLLGAGIQQAGLPALPAASIAIQKTRAGLRETTVRLIS